MIKKLRVIFDKASREKGSLLIEVLLTVVILSVSVTVIIQSLVTSLKATLNSSDYTKASLLLEDKMFDYVTKRYIKKTFSDKGTFPEPYDDFRYETDARPVELDDASIDEERYKGINEVKMKVMWGSEEREKSLSIVTFMFDEELKDPLHKGDG